MLIKLKSAEEIKALCLKAQGRKAERNKAHDVKLTRFTIQRSQASDRARVHRAHHVSDRVRRRSRSIAADPLHDYAQSARPFFVV